MTTFDNLHIIPQILKNLEKKGYKNPTPIQEKSIPIVLSGGDLIGCAQTGTGKTAAFSLPILQNLLKEKKRVDTKKGRIQTLVLTPTRELAIQIGENVEYYAQGTGLSYTVIFGGVGAHPQMAKLRKGVDILIATPGRLLDLKNQGCLDFRDLKIFVLDEADRMLDMGFLPDVKRIISALPKKRQTLFFSATMPDSIRNLANTILTNPKKVEVAPVSSTAEKIKQKLYHVEKSKKRDLLVHVLKTEATDSTLVFARTKWGADKVAKMLTQSGIPSEAIHGNKSQNARQNALKNFKERKIRVLIATDIAARGIDIDHLSHVINFEIPNEPETYVHRIGRTGRAGKSGIALSFCDHEEQAYIHDINKLTQKTIPLSKEHPYHTDHAPLLSKKKPSKRRTFPKGGHGGRGSSRGRR